eukprot:TRINITY_DN2389_c0_g2_i7.p6 TRINITY_DN2389_c0_g2~~TRINITY_DN2389_c0_g2_i7.p6  ORF type:complete len:109 (-),score=17.45 TRINITY_DN2389_c0_g2_i7:726-1052(-)
MGEPQDQKFTLKDGNINGCANPDNDQTGEWCIVDPDTCVNTPPGNSESVFPKKELEDGFWFDHCQCRNTLGAPGGKVSLGDIGAKSSLPNTTISVVDCDPAVVPSCTR